VKVAIRLVTKFDLVLIENWYQNINGSIYLSRYRPKEFDGQEFCKPGTYVWYVIQADEKDCGVIWLEKNVPDERDAVLGVMLGETCYLGKGIGERAIHLAITQSLQYLRYNKVCLHVRKSNIRAVACYIKCGFCITGEGKKEKEGKNVEYWDMVLDLHTGG
jgi:RimJ/RimL family protein N-acetyltransferase